MTDKSEDGSSNVNYRGEISTCYTDKNDSKEQASTEKNLPTITLPTQNTERPTTFTHGSIMACFYNLIPFRN